VFGFAFFAGCAISAAAYLAIPETRPLASSSDDSILRSYLVLLAEPRLVGYVLQSGVNTASFMTMASAAATLMKELLQRPSSEFGLYFLLFPSGFFCGTLISSRVGSRVSNELMVLLGSLLAMATIMLQGWLFFWELVTPWTFFLPGFVLTFSQGIALPYAQVGAMAVIPRLAATAAGIGVFMQNFGGAVFAQLYGLFADGTPLPMVAILLCSGSLCLVAGTLPFVLRRGQRG